MHLLEMTDIAQAARCIRASAVTGSQTARRPTVVMVILLAVAACASIGPGTVQRDRLNYISAIAESWKEQTLLNVVRLRYGDAPSFADVSSVISGYTFQEQVSAGAAISSDLTATIPSRLVTLGGNATYQDRPTISYTPLAGDRFARSLLRPLPPSEVFELVQAGYPADSVLLVTIRAINGIYNRSGVGARARQADPILPAARRLAAPAALRRRQYPPGQTRLRRGGHAQRALSSARAQTVSEDLQFVRKTLGVAPDRNGETSVTFGLLPRNPNEIALLTRSMAEILQEVAAGIEYRRPRRAGPHAQRDAAGQRREHPRSPVRAHPVVCVQTCRELCRRALSEDLVLDRRRRLRLEAHLLIPDDLLFAGGNRCHAAGSSAHSAGKLMGR